MPPDLVALWLSSRLWISDCGPRSEPGVTTLRIGYGVAAGRPRVVACPASGLQ